MSAQYILDEVNRRMDGIDVDYAAQAEEARLDALADVACSIASDPDYLGWQVEQAFYASEFGSGEDAHPQFCECDECVPLDWHAGKVFVAQVTPLTWHEQHIIVQPRSVYAGPLCCDCGGPLTPFFRADSSIGGISCAVCDLPF